MSRKATLLEVAVRRTGSWRIALEAMRYLVSWGRASDRAGHALDAFEYADALRVSNATAFRRQQSWRKCFAAESDTTPARMWELARPNLDARASERVQVAQACALVPGFD